MSTTTVKLVNQAPILATLPTAPLPESVDMSEMGTGIVLDQEKKIRREIANSNERRRMQSINAGFQSLRTLLPHHEGEKLSKAAILQQTAEYIYSLEQEKTRLLAQNCHLKRLLSLSQQNIDSTTQDNTTTGPTEVKRKKIKQEIKEAVMEPRVTGHTELRLVKEQEKPSVTIVPPQSIVNAVSESQPQPQQQPQVTIELPKQEPPQLPQTPLPKQQTANLKSGETCRIILANNRIAPETLVVPIQPPAVVAATEVEPKSEKVQNASSGSRSYIVTNSSKQNLDSIVEAIKHLEGDHLFSSEDVKVPQEVAQEEVVEYSLSDVVTAARPAPISAAQIQLPTSPVKITSSTTSKDSFIIFKN